ncbi:E3 ubiquitin-protein ligase RFI2 [Mucuna pruriens]|uniref:E3 ubiquitin-protein ligase RFI2 n=1 Tax=Mucuna pruriens TaxID=157652 RepID=A0A371F9T3_MUCPR|nr:E3 ubiquitin-protein ligase RFI2 [Mucuna pruriens]
MGLGNDDDDGDASHNSFGSVPCSICLEAVTDNGDRSWAKLQCGHQFHLDCIGSAFNIKGAMQCPNCRKIEKGQWLYANGSRSYPEFSMDEWTHDEDLYDVSYSEMSFGVHWCPFDHDILGQPAIFAEHTAVSSASHACPYIAYFGPIHPSTSNSGGTVSEASNFNHWNGPPVPGDMPTSYTFPAVDLHYHSWEHNSSHFSSASSRLGTTDQTSVSPSSQRPARGGSEVPRSGSFMHPFLVGHSSAARAGNSVASSMIPPYPGSNARARDRVQALQAYYQPHNSTTIRTPVASNTRRSSSHSGSVQLAPVASSPDQSGGFVYIPSASSGRNFPEETHLPSRFHAWERGEHLPSLVLNHVGRESSWRAYHQTASVSDPSIRSSSFRLRHESERMPSQNR